MSNTVGTVSCSGQDLITKVPEKVTIIVISVSASVSTSAGVGNPS